jgi:hypothetical protein
MIQPIKDRVHPAYEYRGQSDPTGEVNRKVSKEEMAARVSQIYWEGQGEEVLEGTLVEETGRPGKILRSVFRSLCFAFLIHLGRIAFMSSVSQMRELQMWCPASLPEREIHRRKLRSDKYKPPAAGEL